jgi:LysR family transcriptional regulator for metE and metH
MKIELRHLRSVQAINQSGNLARAAEQLHLTQSALSHQIKTLESYFEVNLYHRQHKPLKLTAAGQELLKLARQVLPEVESTEYKLQRMASGNSGRLHITIECHSCFEWLIPTLDHYRKRWPDVEVDIRLGVNFDPMPALSQGDIDLVITSDPMSLTEIVFEALFDYEAMAIMPNDHSLTSKAMLVAEDFRQQTLITYPVAQNRLDIFNHFLNPAGIMPAQIRQSELTAMILQLVASRRGIAVLPDWVLEEYLNRDYVTARPLQSAAGRKGLTGTLYAAIRQREAGQVYLADFICLAREGLSLRKKQPDQ